MGGRRRLHTGIKPIGGHAIKSRRKARFVTSEYHRFRHELISLEDADLTREEKELKVSALNHEIEKIGGKLVLQFLASAAINILPGIDAYQQASVISTQFFKTSKWAAKTLLNIFPDVAGKIRTLEVGAINTQLLDHQKLDVRAIDINSQNARIEECDFFSLVPNFDYDAVVCSMVRHVWSPSRQRYYG
jgi:25S rRNA (adenine2142-N1)-methyltransferase